MFVGIHVQILELKSHEIAQKTLELKSHEIAQKVAQNYHGTNPTQTGHESGSKRLHNCNQTCTKFCFGGGADFG